MKMRTIDADALRDEVDSTLNWNTNNEYNMYSDVMNMIDNAPTIDVQPVKRGRWITKAGDYYKKWQNSGRSWDDMPYFITGEHIACSECFTEYNVCTEGIEHWTGCPCCLARMNGGEEDENSI
jgi:hypothetical protein